MSETGARDRLFVWMESNAKRATSSAFLARMSQIVAENRLLRGVRGRNPSPPTRNAEAADLVPLGKLRKVDVRNQGLRAAFCMDGGTVGKVRNWSAEIGLLGGPLVDAGESKRGWQTGLPKSSEMEAF
jgi:hypothetical protein